MMTWAITRLQEAIDSVFSSDADLISLTNDGVEDGRGTLHHIGFTLNVPGLKDRLPFLAFQAVDTVPLIFNTARAHIFRSSIMAMAFSSDECVTNKIADRVQYLLTTPDDTHCNGYLDFSNAHIWNYNTEFKGRMPGGPNDMGFDKHTEVYIQLIEFEVIWTDVPCGEIVEPDCQACEVLIPYDYCYQGYIYSYSYSYDSGGGLDEEEVEA